MNRMARHGRSRIDPHVFEASTDMLASDDTFAMGRPDEEMDRDDWLGEPDTGRRSDMRRGTRPSGVRRENPR